MAKRRLVLGPVGQVWTCWPGRSELEGSEPDWAEGDDGAEQAGGPGAEGPRSKINTCSEKYVTKT